MSYIGKQPEFTQYPSKFFDGDGTAMTVTLDYAPPNDAALLVFIDGVRQDTSAYSCTGTSCTFTGAVPSGTANVQVVHMGLTVDVGVPGDDTVSTVKIQDDAVTVAKLANSINTDIDANTAKTGITSGQASAITANTAKVTNATHTGDVTGATALTIATDAVDIAMLSATGTASSSTFLRGDNAWAAAGGLSDASIWRLTTDFSGDAAPIASNLEEADTYGYSRLGAAFTESSGIFTFPSTGYWHITANRVGGGGGTNYVIEKIAIMSTVNDSTYNMASEGAGNACYAAYSGYSEWGNHCEFIFDVTDTAQCKVRFDVHDSADGTGADAATLGSTNTNLTYFVFMKIGAT
jgi:hypothetical protein